MSGRLISRTLAPFVNEIDISHEFKYKIYIFQQAELGFELSFTTAMVIFFSFLVYMDLYLMLRDPFYPMKKRIFFYKIYFVIWFVISVIYSVTHSPGLFVDKRQQ